MPRILRIDSGITRILNIQFSPQSTLKQSGENYILYGVLEIKNEDSYNNTDMISVYSDLTDDDGNSKYIPLPLTPEQTEIKLNQLQGVVHDFVPEDDSHPSFYHTMIFVIFKHMEYC